MKKYIGILILMLLFSYQCVYATEENLLNGQQQSTLIEEEDTENNDSDFIQNSNIMYEDYFVQLEDLYKYNIISLQNADINCHIRGSIWVGNILTGSQYVDDGSLDGVAASNSYIFNNQSNIYFKSRTNEQSLTSYKGIFDSSVNNAIQYWTTILESFPNNENFIYVNPDENGFVDLKKWDYQSQGSDELQQTIPKVYWTNATSVEMGGLAGHLIAPFADIHIVSCNHRGSILGWNIYTDGESHINYWTPDIKGGVTPTPTPTETPTPTPTEVPVTPTPTITPVTPTPTQIPKPTPPDIPDNPKPPKTGDEQDFIPLILLLIISLETIFILFLQKKKNKI